MPSRRDALGLCAALAVLLLAGTAWAQARGAVSGQVVDENGKPVAGIHVEAVNLSIPASRRLSYGRSVKAEGSTGPDGRYRLNLAGLPPGEYQASAFETVRNGEREVIVDLVPETRETFTGNDTVVRNFRREIIETSPEYPYGNAGIFVLDATGFDTPDLGAAIVTLEPQGRSAPAIVRPVRSSGEGLVVTGVPFGTYRASATLDGRPLRLQLALPDAGETFATSVVHAFTMGTFGNQLRVFAKP